MPNWQTQKMGLTQQQKEVSVRNMELTSHHQLEEFRKGQKEMPHVLPASRILLADIHLG